MSSVVELPHASCRPWFVVLADVDFFATPRRLKMSEGRFLMVVEVPS